MKTEGRVSWERFNTAIFDWGGYLLLATSTLLALAAGFPDTAWLITTFALVAAAAVWIYFMFTRLPEPREKHRIRVTAFFVGLLVIGSVLLLQREVFFIFMISGFIYAASLRPIWLIVAGTAATSVLINTLLAGLPTTVEQWSFYLPIIVIQTLVISGGVIAGIRVSQQNEERRETVARLEEALEENAGLHAQLVAQAREAGVLDERARMAREIHDTIAQGLIGIVTQIEAARAPQIALNERARHLDNAEKLARSSLTEARRSVEASVPAALETATLPDALEAVAQEWTSMNSIPVEVRVTGDAIALNSEIEVALLRTAQEALANVARHSQATRVALTLSYMGDEVTLDVRDDGVGFATSGDAATSLGFGLTAMRRRIARVAGTLAIESEPGAGTALSARVPAIAAGAAGGAGQ